MTKPSTKNGMFATISMAEIFLSQNLTTEAEQVIQRLQVLYPEDPRVDGLSDRLMEMKRPSSPEILPAVLAEGVDRVVLRNARPGVGIEWEITEAGLSMAKRAVRYSGRTVIRLFTAAAGRRGVRTGMRDIDLQTLIGRTSLAGLPRPAVHTAAVGYLANTGIFISCAQSATLKVLI